MKVSALILAGGESRRMGHDKRFFVFRKQSLLERAYQLGQQVADEVRFLIAKPEDQSKIEKHLGASLRFVLDRQPGSGPMAALIGGLSEMKHDTGLLLAVDFPLMTGSFIAQMRDFFLRLNPNPKALIPLADGRAQVTCAFYKKSLAAEMKSALDLGERSLSRWLEGRPDGVRLLLPEDWQRWGDERLFTNLNRPADLPPQSP